MVGITELESSPSLPIGIFPSSPTLYHIISQSKTPDARETYHLQHFCERMAGWKYSAGSGREKLNSSMGMWRG
jgi:hypothetical protein